MPNLADLSDRYRAFLDGTPIDEEEIEPFEVDCRHLRETIQPTMAGYAETLLDGGAAESAAHVIRLLVIVTEQALGRETLRRSSFESMRSVLDELMVLASEWAAAGSPSTPQPPALVRLENEAAAGRITPARMLANLREVVSWLEEPGRSFDEDAGAGLLERINAVSSAPWSLTPTLAEALQLFALRARAHQRLASVTIT